MGAVREARSQLAAERTLDFSGGTGPPVAGSPGNGAPPLGGKLSRSLRSLRPIAAASVVAGPRRFAEGAWAHPVRPDDGPTNPPTTEAVRPHPGPGTPRGLDHTPGPGTPRGLDHTPGPGIPRGWAAAMGRNSRSE